MQSKINGNWSLDLLKDVWFGAGLRNWLTLKQTNKKEISTAQRSNDHELIQNCVS